MKSALNITIWLLLLVWINGALTSPARAQAFPNICPAPAHWVNVGAAIMCQCPNGIFLGLGQTCPAPRVVDQSQTSFRAKYEDYLRHWNVCFGAPSDAELESAVAACNQALSFGRTIATDRNNLVARIAGLQQRLAFRREWDQCFGSAQTQAEAIDAETACEQALTYSQLIPLDRDRLNGQRTVLQAKITQLQRDLAEQQTRDRYLQQKQACMQYDADACTIALGSPYANENDDRVDLQGFLASAQRLKIDVAGCKQGSARSCDLAASSIALKESDGPSIERWRAATSPLSKALALVLGYYDVAQFILIFAPRSTIIASSIAGLLTLTLLGVLIRQRVSRKRLRYSRGDRSALADVKPAIAAAEPDGPSVPERLKAAPIQPTLSNNPLKARASVITAVDKRAIKQAFKDRRVEFEL